MKIAILGAGIIGITTAYELSADGHEVHIYERRNSACEEGSFANAGVVAPGYVTPFAATGMPALVLASLFQKNATTCIQLPLRHGELGWLWQWRKACKSAAYLSTQKSTSALARYSAERLQHLSAMLELEYEKTQGYLVLLRTEQQIQNLQTRLKILGEEGYPHRLLDAAGARKIEPALSTTTALHGALHLPNDGVANCRQFALLLREVAQRLSATFHFGTSVSTIQKGLQGIELTFSKDAGLDVGNFDQVVLCAGVESAALLRTLGIKLPLIPVYGYSMSAPIREPIDAPVSGVMDERYKVAISRIGSRVRVAGGAHIGGDPTANSAAPIQTLYRVLEDWFPVAADIKAQASHSAGARVQIWKGARPMLASGPPRVGQTTVPGVWLNVGHGSSGWALACGSARVLADKILGKKTTIEL